MQSIDDTTNGDYALNLPERYRVIEELGQGGMSRVYRAVDDLLKKDVAIKILHTDAQADPRKLVAFQREARITAQLKHQNIVNIIDFGLTDAGQPYLVMDYVRGESLAEVLSRAGRLSVADSLPLVFEILDAVKYAHSQGVLHRDLKPGNILIAENPEDEVFVKLIDFGLARFADPDQHDTGSGGIHGTPAYMSPEQARGQNLDQRSEVYSLGCVLFSIWTACPPFDGNTAMKVLNQHCEKKPPRLSDMQTDDSVSNSGGNAFTEEMEQLIARCLAKAPNDRFQTVEELETTLKTLEDAQPIGATPDSGARLSNEPENHSVKAPAQRPGLLLSSAITLLILIVVGLAVFIYMTNAATQNTESTADNTKGSTRAGSLANNFSGPPLEDLNLDRKWVNEFERATSLQILVCPPAYPLEDADLMEIAERTDFQKLKLRNHVFLKGTTLRFIKNPNLVNVDIADASLSEEGWKSLAEMQAPLTHLDVGQNSTFKGAYLKYLLMKPTLVDVAIPLKNIEPKDVAVLSKHPSLRSLMLCGKYKVDRDVLREFAKLKKLKVLNFDGTKLKPEDLELLRAGTNEAMGFSSMAVTPQIMQKVAELPIKRLALHNCESLEIDGLMELRRSKTLKKISISHCGKITKFDLATARKSLAPKKIDGIFSW